MLIAWQGAGGYPYPVGLSFNNQPLILPTPPSPTQQTQNTFVQRVPLFITQKPNDALTLQVYNLESNSQTIHPISWSYQDVAGHH